MTRVVLAVSIAAAISLSWLLVSWLTAAASRLWREASARLSLAVVRVPSQSDVTSAHALRRLRSRTGLPKNEVDNARQQIASIVSMLDRQERLESAKSGSGFGAYRAVVTRRLRPFIRRDLEAADAVLRVLSGTASQVSSGAQAMAGASDFESDEIALALGRALIEGERDAREDHRRLLEALIGDGSDVDRFLARIAPKAAC